ncbi:ornithine cyclodeaminase family protein [Parasulfitobacter algicola]|uniref:Ornithine cyclodeaminase n=1 Tax=Parasulfitobacter algicola TaxID=2614809 RepID=A0ABX2ISU4_9RHOB|nr:ornithine cyclodeaminase [Sulfitobacter algicola]NSX55979.1 ornithine cyclodeaminase [Sulfitobacter algicola]
MTIEIVPIAAGDLLDWHDLTDAIAAGHDLPKAEVGDTFLYRDPDTLLSRSAWIDGMGLAVKTATIFPGNTQLGKRMVNGVVSLFSNKIGELEALIDFHLVTKWKTAGDSLLAAKRLARPDAKTILIIGAGTVGRSLREAYGAAFPDANFTIWNRTPEGAKALVRSYDKVSYIPDLETAVMDADIITSATMSTEPLIKGAWLKPGQHIDLIGAYRADMREADDEALQKSRVFVDSFATTIDHIGELKTPLQSGAIARADVVADYYDLSNFQRQSNDEITLFKNGGGAHLDLMVSRYILDVWRNR